MKKDKAIQIPDFHVLIAAAGRGRRFGETIPKQYVSIHGKTILRHTLERALSWPGLQSLHVIINPDDEDLYQSSVKGLNLPDFIAGGKERKNSIYNGLKSLPHLKDENIILIHDAARPCVEWKDVQNLLLSINSHTPAASLASPLTDTIRRTCIDQTSDIVDRDGLWALQTPQAFSYGALKKAHENATDDQNHTDDTSLVTSMGMHVKLVQGSPYNLKITTAEDIKIASALLQDSTYETRIGQGFDVHAFEQDANTARPLMLCGIKIDHPYALVGHSDADVGLHALTDSILGAIGAGDIGVHFPPSDNKFKDMDSAVFVEKAVDMLADKGGQLVNIDLTLICETPKITPHTAAMKTRISQITGLPENRINIKATTTEKLGFTGRGEGIAAQCVVNVKIPTTKEAA